MDELNEYTKNHDGNSNPEVLKNTTIYCEKVSSCLHPIRCKEAVEAKATMEKSCDMLHVAGKSNLKCLMSFFRTSYMAQSSNEPTCFRQHDFLEKNLTKRQKAYAEGEACFISHIKEHCDEYSIDYFSKNYRKFADSISIKPPGTECVTAHNLLNTVHCRAIEEETTKLVKIWEETSFQPNDTRKAQVLKMCRDTEKCMRDSCLIPPFVVRTLTKSCDVLAMTQNHAYICIAGVTKDKPDLSKFKCLGEMNFYEPTPQVACQKFTSKKECTKEIMIDVCEKESIVDFDKTSEMLKKLLRCN